MTGIGGISRRRPGRAERVVVIKPSVAKAALRRKGRKRWPQWQ